MYRALAIAAETEVDLRARCWSEERDPPSPGEGGERPHPKIFVATAAANSGATLIRIGVCIV